ncbi:hypothetical protein M422DRAFT_259686 [Sphaerobolus stellatus SS14]|uniref:CCHC-type domain-containing protein n=1 Tax=Sphaerobolus stellatus (strain SS14) TaxID=990650 RepID=A0A0C9VJJ6_SPHS4|nr:hypothetical protein M422DRAFT_259686 [Sphaerobolus stellatus SS14]
MPITGNTMSNNSSGNAGRSSGNNTTTSNKGKTKQKSTPTNDIGSKLGPDGKLLPAECQRCIDGGLCLVCGKSGHMAKDCLRAKTTPTTTTTTQTKARTARIETVTDSTESAEASGSKN